MPPKSKTKAKKAPKGRGKSTAKAKPAVVVVGSKVMTLQQKQKEEEQRLKEFILTRSYGQLQERVEDISERLQEVRGKGWRGRMSSQAGATGTSTLRGCATLFLTSSLCPHFHSFGTATMSGRSSPTRSRE